MTTQAHIGDVVRVGNGRTTWTVVDRWDWGERGMRLRLRSLNSGRRDNRDASRVTVVERLDDIVGIHVSPDLANLVTPNDDPLEEVTAAGYQVVWLDNLRGSVFVVDDLMVVLADSELSREQVAASVLDSAHDDGWTAS